MILVVNFLLGFDGGTVTCPVRSTVISTKAPVDEHASSKNVDPQRPDGARPGDRFWGHFCRACHK